MFISRLQMVKAAEAEAEAIRKAGEAQAAVVRAKGLAEADRMAKKAEAWKNYTESAYLEMLINRLPEARALRPTLHRQRDCFSCSAHTLFRAVDSGRAVGSRHGPWLNADGGWLVDGRDCTAAQQHLQDRGGRQQRQQRRQRRAGGGHGAHAGGAAYCGADTDGPGRGRRPPAHRTSAGRGRLGGCGRSRRCGGKHGVRGRLYGN
jgi:hypothetical protein